MSEPTERVRSLAEIREQLDDLQKAKMGLERIEGSSLAAELTLSSLRASERQLLHEQSAALLVEDGHSLEVVLEGEAVVHHTIEATFLSDVLGRFQRLLDGVAQAREGRATTTGRVPEAIRANVRMMVAAMVPGSFAVRLEIPDQAEQLFGDDVVQATLGLFEAEPSVETFLPLMRLGRVKTNYEELAQSLISHNSRMSVRTKTGKAVDFTPEMAKERLEWIRLVDTQENVFEIRGELIGGNVESKSYVIATEDEHFRGKVLESALDELRRVALGSQIKARLLLVTKTQVDGIVTPREEHYLESIHAIDTHSQERLSD